MSENCLLRDSLIDRKAFLAQIGRGISVFRVPTLGHITDAADARVDRDTYALRMVFHALEVRRLETLVIAKTRKLYRIQLQTRGVIQILNVFPVEIADRKSIESQPDPFTRRARGCGQRCARSCLEKCSAKHLLICITLCVKT